MKDDAIYVKIEAPLKKHINQHVNDKKLKGGLSGLVRRLLIRETKYKDNHIDGD
jgi:hypothetical protein